MIQVFDPKNLRKVEQEDMSKRKKKWIKYTKHHLVVAIESYYINIKSKSGQNRFSEALDKVNELVYVSYCGVRIRAKSIVETEEVPDKVCPLCKAYLDGLHAHRKFKKRKKAKSILPKPPKGEKGWYDQ